VPCLPSDKFQCFAPTKFEAATSADVGASMSLLSRAKPSFAPARTSDGAFGFVVSRRERRREFPLDIEFVAPVRGAFGRCEMERELAVGRYSPMRGGRADPL